MTCTRLGISAKTKGISKYVSSSNIITNGIANGRQSKFRYSGLHSPQWPLQAGKQPASTTEIMSFYSTDRLALVSFEWIESLLSTGVVFSRIPAADRYNLYYNGR